MKSMHRRDRAIPAAAGSADHGGMSTTSPSSASGAAPARLPAALRLGPVALTVTDLGRAIAFYEQAIGLQLQQRDPDAGTAALGTGGEDLVVLVEDRAARPAGRHAGLYHYALLFPSRLELARVAVRLAMRRTPIQGASDHGTHEAIYLPDPDGNGIELAADRPREVWPEGLGYTGGPAPLDVNQLLSLVAGEPPRAVAGPGMTMGHLHLHVGDVDRGLAFYRDVIGFDLMALLPSAAFVSAGGYHHHLGFNVWQGLGVPPAPAGTVGLRQWTVELPEAADVAALRARAEAAGAPVEERDGGVVVRDPWDIAMLVRAAR
jgi:catechol 2,3-dioxygenase